MKKGITIRIAYLIIGMLISGLGVYAAVSISSDKISYNNTTVDAALDTLFDESVSGKTKIAEAITNKGIETLDTDSYDTIVSNINNISTGNPNLRLNEETGYIQAYNIDGTWKDISYVGELPIRLKYLLENRVYNISMTNPVTTVSATSPDAYQWAYGYIYSKETIDLTPYKTLHVDLTASNLIQYSNFWVGFGTSTSTSGIVGCSGQTGGSLTCDISGLNGEYYLHIGVGVCGSYSFTGSITVTNIWVE